MMRKNIKRKVQRRVVSFLLMLLTGYILDKLFPPVVAAQEDE